MFFISRGEVEIRSNLFANELSDGAHFGEACLFSSAMKRSANVVALTTVHIYLLHRSDYVQVRQYSRRVRRISHFVVTFQLDTNWVWYGFRLDKSIYQSEKNEIQVP